jgi:hypothetical protein
VQEVGVARLNDAPLAQHLPDDDLDVLVVDVHALLLVHVLDLANEVFLHAAHALEFQDLLRIERALRSTGRPGEPCRQP